jgi:hypothetical protein
LPELEDGVEEDGGAAFVASEEGGANAFAADLVAGALVGELGTPAAGGDESAVGHAAGDVGAGAGHGEDADAALERCVESDFYVAEEERFAGDAGGEGFAEPVGDERNGFAGGADAGARDGLHGDAGAGGEFGECLIEVGGGGGGVGAHALDGAGADACELASFVGEEVVGFGAADVEG